MPLKSPNVRSKSISQEKSKHKALKVNCRFQRSNVKNSPWTLRFGRYMSYFCYVYIYRLTYERWSKNLYCWLTPNIQRWPKTFVQYCTKVLHWTIFVYTHSSWLQFAPMNFVYANLPVHVVYAMESNHLSGVVVTNAWTFLYKSLSRPHMEYAYTVWDPHQAKDIKSIENTQKFALRVWNKLELWRQLRGIAFCQQSHNHG